MEAYRFQIFYEGEWLGRKLERERLAWRERESESRAIKWEEHGSQARPGFVPQLFSYPPVTSAEHHSLDLLSFLFHLFRCI